MNIQQIAANPIGTIVYRESDPKRLYIIGKRILETLLDFLNPKTGIIFQDTMAFALTIEELLADDRKVKHGVVFKNNIRSEINEHN